MSTPPNDPSTPGQGEGFGQSGGDPFAKPSGDVPPPPAAPPPNHPSYGSAPPPSGQAGYPQQGYPQQPGYGTPAPAGTNGLGIAALVLGVLALLLVCLPIPFVCVLVAIGGIVCGVLGLRKARRGEAGQRGLALWGMIISIVAAVLGAVVGFLIIAGIGLFGDAIEECAGLPEDEIEACVEDSVNNRFGN